MAPADRLQLKTTFLGCKHAVPLLEARGGGAIVNLSSIAGLRMLAGRAHVAYSASKAGVIGLSKSVAISYAKAGIRCNTVVPGLMHTPLGGAPAVETAWRQRRRDADRQT